MKSKNKKWWSGKWVAVVAVLRLLAILLIANPAPIGLLVLSSCANEAPPSGGRRDSTMPKMVYAKPASNTLHFNTDEITIKFSEYIQNPINPQEVVISPPTDKAPKLLVEGRKLHIHLKSTLKPNTTYTINFGNAIKDNNEGNPLRNFRYVFSTGDMLDSASLNGTLINIADPNDVDGLLVELYPVDSPEAIKHSKPSYFSRSDKGGNYKIENIKAGQYWMYILKDQNLNYIYDQPTEMIGFRDSLLTITDSSKLTANGLVFSNERTKSRLGEPVAAYPGRVLLPFSGPVDRMVFKSSIERATDILLPNATKDTFTYWYSAVGEKEVKFQISVNDSATDSARVSLKSIRPDSILDRKKYALTIDNQQVKTDTNNRYGTKPILSSPFKPIILNLSRPVVGLSDFKRVQIVNDSTHKIEDVTVKMDSVSKRALTLLYTPEEKSSYTVQIPDSLFMDQWGWWNNASKIKWLTDTKENYGTIILSLKIENTSKYYVLQILNEENQIVKTFWYKGNQDKKVTLPNMPSGKYRLKAIEDLNHNGEWDTGNFDIRRQPERIISFKESYELKGNWDLEIEVKL